MSPAARTIGIDLIRRLNSSQADEYPDDPAMAARVASYELAFRMQRSVPEVVDFSQETAETKSLYGLDKPACREFGMQLLAARRFVERGVELGADQVLIDLRQLGVGGVQFDYPGEYVVPPENLVRPKPMPAGDEADGA